VQPPWLRPAIISIPPGFAYFIVSIIPGLGLRIRKGAEIREKGEKKGAYTWQLQERGSGYQG
jgi:hypothetical protein